MVLLLDTEVAGVHFTDHDAQEMFQNENAPRERGILSLESYI
jgi:hypothetical protein